jgi:hypothetical protein
MLFKYVISLYFVFNVFKLVVLSYVGYFLGTVLENIMDIITLSCFLQLFLLRKQFEIQVTVRPDGRVEFPHLDRATDSLRDLANINHTVVTIETENYTGEGNYVLILPSKARQIASYDGAYSKFFE